MVNCPRCYNTNVRLDGKGHTDEQHYRCKECNHHFNERTPSGAKVLCFDIETAPNVGYFWGVWQQNISHIQVIEPWHCLTWSAKWLYDNEVMGDSLTSKEARNHNDRRIVKSLWKLFDQADILIAHYGDGFDIPRMNTRFLLHNLGVPSPYRSIDTKKIASQRFAFNHNKLDALARELGIGHKVDTGGFELWDACYHGDKEALAKMLKYNKKDVLLLEEVYLVLRAWAKSHPNMNLWQKEDGCSHCGSLEIRSKGHYITQVNKYRSFVCENCGAYSRETKKSYASLAR